MVRRLFKNMLMAQIMSSVAITVCMLIDSIMIGQFLGVDAMAAYGLASPFLLLFAAFGAILSMGIQVVCSRMMAEGNKDGVNKTFSVSIVFAAVLSVVAMLLVIIMPNQICRLLGATEGTVVFDLTKKYLQGFLLGTPAFIAAQIFVPYLQLSNNRMRLVLSVSIMTVADIILDIVNVFIFKGGIFGMGMASAISYYAAIILAVIYFFSKKCIYKFRPRGLRFSDALEVLKSGVPTAVNQICYVLQIYTLNNILISSGKSDYVAVYSILTTIGNFCFSTGNGIGSVALTLSGIFYVEEDRNSLEEIVKIVFKYAILMNIVVTAVFFAFSPFIVQIFMSGEKVPLDLASYALKLFSLCFIPAAVNSALKNYYQGVHRTWFTNLIALLQNLVFVSIAAFIFNAAASERTVFFSFLVGETLTFISISVIIWKINGKITMQPSAFAFLPKNFGVAKEDTLQFSVSTVEDICKSAGIAANFCMERSRDERRSMIVSLCIEEVANNIVQHGFEDGRSHYIDIRVSLKPDKWIIGIRDDCRLFDPVRYMRKYGTERDTSHFGIKLMFYMANDVKYVNTLGLNNLTITI